MGPLFDAVDALARLLHRLSGLMLILMMATVVVDVASRSLYSVSDGRLDVTFLGGIEVVSYGLLFCILFALPHCVDKGQVVVDLFSQNISPKAERIVTGLYTLGFAALGLLMSWRFFHAFRAAQASLETTQDLLVPLAYVYGVVAFATLVLGVRSLTVSARCLFGLKKTERAQRTCAGHSTAVKGEAL